MADWDSFGMNFLLGGKIKAGFYSLGHILKSLALETLGPDESRLALIRSSFYLAR